MKYLLKCHVYPLAGKLVSFVFPVLVLMLAAQSAWAQNNDNNEQPLYLKYPSIPQFSIVTQNEKTFTQKDLKKNKPTLIFLFSVDCEHCQHETEEIAADIHKFKGTQILMVTHFPVKDMQGFYKQYNIAKCPEITMGTDARRWLLSFYFLHYFPGLYVYNKEDKLVYHHEGTTPVDTLLHYLKPNEY